MAFNLSGPVEHIRSALNAYVVSQQTIRDEAEALKPPSTTQPESAAPVTEQSGTTDVHSQH